uniref:Importin subunit alpha n=1 Tax=Alexandrium catenella TaxID=2925 RepID=A0A7S1S9Q5_ALECA
MYHAQPAPMDKQDVRQRFGIGGGLRRRAENAAARTARDGAAEPAVLQAPELSAPTAELDGLLRTRRVPRPSVSARRPQRSTGPSAKEASEVASLIDSIAGARSDPIQAVRALTRLRGLICSTTKPCTQALIDAGGLPVLVERLRESSPVMQFEAAWVFTNIASGSSAQASAMVSAGAVEAVLDVLASPAVAERPELCDQCLCALANVAGDEDLRLRDWVLLEAGAVGHLGRLYEQVPGFAWSFHSRMQVLRSLTWLMSALCRGQPAPPLEEVDCAFDYFAQVLLGADDVEMLAEAVWGLCYLVEGGLDDRAACTRAARLLSAGLAGEQLPLPPAQHPLLVKLVQCARVAGERTNPLAVPALRLLGTLLSTSADAVGGMVVAAGALSVLTDVALDPFAPLQVRCEAAWSLSNVAAGAQAQHLLDSTRPVAALCDILESDAPQGLRSECAWALANVVRCGRPLPRHVDHKRLLRLIDVALSAGLEAALEPVLLEAAQALVNCGGELLCEARACGLLERLQGREAPHGLPEPKPCPHDDGANRENRPPQNAKLGKDRVGGLQLGSVNHCVPLQLAKLNRNA